MVSVVFLHVMIYAVHLESVCVKIISILLYIEMRKKEEQNLNANCHFINDD